ncbi:MAG: hypothetical protein L6420_09225 [Elusimicrobia bacterium]|nr:hypothetical protein [Elusimicrobiota bacterium]
MKKLAITILTVASLASNTVFAFASGFEVSKRDSGLKFNEITSESNLDKSAPVRMDLQLSPVETINPSELKQTKRGLKSTVQPLSKQKEPKKESSVTIGGNTITTVVGVVGGLIGGALGAYAGGYVAAAASMGSGATAAFLCSAAIPIGAVAGAVIVGGGAALIAHHYLSK